MVPNPPVGTEETAAGLGSHLLPRSAVIKNVWISTSTPHPSIFVAVCYIYLYLHHVRTVHYEQVHIQRLHWFWLINP